MSVYLSDITAITTCQSNERSVLFSAVVMRNSITLGRVRVREICQTFGMFVDLYHGKGKESK